MLSSPGAVLFNAGCNDQVFFLNTEKQFGADPSCCFREKRKNHQLRCTPITKNDVTVTDGSTTLDRKRIFTLIPALTLTLTLTLTLILTLTLKRNYDFELTKWRHFAIKCNDTVTQKKPEIDFYSVNSLTGY